MNIIEKINTIDQLFAKSDEENQQRMMECLDEGVARSYFIRKLSASFEPEWFQFAIGHKILSFSDIPEPIKSDDSEGRATLGFKNWEGAFPIVEAAKAIGEYPRLTALLLKIINEYINLSKERLEDENRNFTVDYHICKAVLLLPIKLIESQQLEFVFDFGLKKDRSLLSRDLTSTFFSRVLDSDENLAMYLLDRFYTPIFEKRLHRAHSIIDDYALDGFSKEIPEKLYYRLGDVVVSWAVDKLLKVSAEHKLMFSKFELTSLEPDPQNSNETNLNFSLVRLVIRLISIMPLDKLERQLEEFLFLNTNITARIAYYLIDRKYESLGHLFWEQTNPLNLFEAKLEIYRLIKRNCENFNTDQIHQIINWTNEMEVDSSEKETEAQHKRYRAYRQLEWYLALEPIHYKYSELLIQPYNNLKEITEGAQPSHPGYDSYFSISTGGNYSSRNRIIGKSATEVLNILANKEKWDGYNIYGLQQDLREYIITSYGEVAPELNKFEALPLPFIYSFVDGFRGMAEKGGTVDINQVFILFRSMIESRDDLWDSSSDDREKSGAIGMIAWAIKTFVGNNEYYLSLDQIGSAIESLVIMESKYDGEFEWLNDEPVNDIINSARGHIYDAMIACSMREVKVKGEPPLWNNVVREVFTKRLLEKSGRVEFYWSLGFNVPQISYLDMPWLESHRDLLIEPQEGKYQLPVFYGYLLFSGQLYRNLYELFYTTYLSQINVEIKNNTIVRRIVEHIWVAYAIELQNSAVLLDRVIEQAEFQKIAFLVDRIKIEDTLQRDEKIKHVWVKMLAIAEESNDRNLREKAFEMVYFTELIHDITQEDLELFGRTISLERSDVNTYRLLKIIESVIRLGHFEIAGQMLNILLQKLSPDAYFDESKLIQIIESLYLHQKIDLANSLAIAAVERRNFNVVSLYNKYSLAV